MRLPFVSSQTWPGWKASYSGMRDLRFREEGALSAREYARLADELEVSLEATVVGVEAEEVVDLSGLDGKLTCQVGASELRGRDGEGDALGFAGCELDPGEAGELLCRPRDADGVHPEVQLHHGGTLDGPRVRH